jgi:DNA-binding NarL/FixJ family response regulator
MPRAGRPPRPLVTPTERQILWGVAAGKTNRAIGSSLGLSEETVKSHVRKMRRRWGAPDRASLLYAAIRRGAIPVVDIKTHLL